MSDTQLDTPEFHVVVRRPGRGPLAPYRFGIVIVFALAIAGQDLLHAAETGAGVDDALTRAGIAGLFAWVVLGRVNAILRQAAPKRPVPVATGDVAPPGTA